MYKITHRKEIDKYSYQVGSYIVTEIPFGRANQGYACQCSMLTGSLYKLYPCDHIKALIEWKKDKT